MRSHHGHGQRQGQIERLTKENAKLQAQLVHVSLENETLKSTPPTPQLKELKLPEPINDHEDEAHVWDMDPSSF